MRWDPKRKRKKEYQRIMEKITVAKKSSEKNIIMDMEELDKIT